MRLYANACFSCQTTEHCCGFKPIPLIIAHYNRDINPKSTMETGFNTFLTSSACFSAISLTVVLFNMTIPPYSNYIATLFIIFVFFLTQTRFPCQNPLHYRFIIFNALFEKAHCIVHIFQGANCIIVGNFIRLCHSATTLSSSV